MTNLLVSITLMITTNWTGYEFGGRELGYLVTNQVAHIEYQGTTNELSIISEAGDVALWRRKPMLSVTNYWIPNLRWNYWTNQNIWITNAIHQDGVNAEVVPTPGNLSSGNTNRPR